MKATDNEIIISGVTAAHSHLQDITVNDNTGINSPNSGDTVLYPGTCTPPYHNGLGLVPNTNLWAEEVWDSPINPPTYGGTGYYPKQADRT